MASFITYNEHKVFAPDREGEIQVQLNGESDVAFFCEDDIDKMKAMFENNKSAPSLLHD